jgi:tRNA/rRNA methyltransferase
MLETGFLDPANPKRLMPRLRRLFSRIDLEKEEVNILRGFLNSLITNKKRPPK